MRLFPSHLNLTLLGIAVIGSTPTEVHPLNLADEPLFITTPVKPNVMLVVDDSGSMDSEVLMPTNDGALWWNTNTDNQSFIGLDADDDTSPGTINYNKAGGANPTWKKYVYLFPNGTGTGNRIYSDSSHDHFAVPPSPEFAFTRSPEYNKAYYDSTKTYTPWPSSYGVTFSDADPQNAPSDPVRGSGTLDLTQEQTNSSSNWTFKLHPGMRDADGDVVSSTQNETFTYYPATFYTAISGNIAYDSSYRNCNSPDPSDYTAFVADPSIVPASVDAIGPDGKCLVKYEIKSGNTFPSGRSYSEEIQNFANWFTYYRKRHLAMRGGVMSAFDDMSGIRTGLFSFNNRPSSVSILDFDTQKSDFFNTLKNFVGSGGTPTRQALKHAGDQFMRTDASAPITEACQKNFTIVFTDGFANPDDLSGIDNEDGGEGAPYADNYSDTLGDIAMKYYRDNLRNDLSTGRVMVPSACHVPSPDPLLDCNEDLHMVTFGVGLGVQGNIYGVTHNTRADAFATSFVWKEPNIQRHPVQVDDLYHAALNGRGELLNATTPDEISTQLQSVMTTIIGATSSSASVATNSTSLATNSVIYQARFNSADWTGQLLSLDIDFVGNISNTPNWDAGEVIDTQSASSRQIITYNRDSGDGMPFRWSDICPGDPTCSGDQADSLNATDDRGDDRVSYLRGNDVSGFRTRTSKLGDIVHSTPFFVGAPKAGYLDSSYASFASTHASRDSIIYVGANDGMLHGFNATTGEEEIAYVPGPVFPNLSSLTDPDYGDSQPHLYFVDGSPMVADAEINSSWKTVLAGGLNGGGQGYYGLDVTDPANFSETNAASLVLWEFTDEDDADLGYTYNQPTLNFLTRQSAQIAKMNNGQWALIVGNGYNNTEDDDGDSTTANDSTTGHAVLFILFLEGGTDGDWTDAGDYIRIDTGEGSTATPNGLATPMPVDVDGDGDVDIAYAGDLEGNLWKFNLTDEDEATVDDPANWSVDLLFSAEDGSNNPQPITTAPMLVPHPQGGYMVGFGTGKYLENADLSTTDTHTLYGIWDSEPMAGVDTVGGRNKLVEQTVLGEVTVSGESYRVTSDNTVTYERASNGSASNSSDRGWYMDLPTTGERVAFNPIARDRRFVYVTLIPDSSDPCAAGGSGWIMELDYLSGSRLSVPPFDITGDKKITDADKVDFDTDGDGSNETVPPSGKKPDIGIPTTPTVVDKDRESEVKVISGSSGAVDTLMEGKSLKTGRLSWRQIIGD
ncbi:MAG: PilC/PilY family type IV pilus protein [Methylohalobius crimeensis]